MCNPDLPIDLFLAKGQVITLNPANHTRTKVFYVGHTKHHRIDGVRQQKIPTGNRPIIFRAQCIQQIIQRAWLSDLSISVDILTNQREDFTIKKVSIFTKPPTRVA